MKPTVIILSAFLSPFRSGAEACAEQVALALCDRYDVTIVTARLCRDFPRHDTWPGGITIRRVGLGCAFDKWLYPFLAPLACRGIAPRVPAGQPVILHAVLETFAGLALYFSQWTCPAAKRLLTLQTLNRRFLKGPIVRSPHAVTAISAALVNEAEALGREGVAVIPNGISLDRIEAALARVARVPGRILFVGRLERMKGVDTLLHVFTELVASYPAAALRIVGDGSERPSLERLAETLGIARRVTFVGFIPADRIAEEFAAAEIFAGLSRSEALGNVFLEAQAAGCPVVATRVGGIPEIVEDGVTGILVPPEDVTAARSALGRLLKDAAFRRMLAERGRERARAYDWGEIAERYAKVYENLLR